MTVQSYPIEYAIRYSDQRLAKKFQLRTLFDPVGTWDSDVEPVAGTDSQLESVIYLDVPTKVSPNLACSCDRCVDGGWCR
jgi:hypothetical protein